MKAKMKAMHLSTFLVVGLLANCGYKAKDVEQDRSDTQAGTTAGEQNLQFIDVGVSVSNAGGGLGLTAAATAFSINIEGCSSGYSTVVDQNSASAKVYKFDRGCLAKLSSVQFNGITYQPDPAAGFISYAEGESASFQDVADPAAKLKVSIIGQLDNPISGLEEIKYAFEEIQAGSDQGLAQNEVSDAHNIEVGGEAAPAFSIAKILFQGITVAGAGQFVIKLGCEDNLVGAGVAASCRGQALSGLKYRLVEDIYGGALDLATAKALIQASSHSIAAGEVIAVGDSLVARGGFVSKLLSGPEQMHSHPNMILIIEANGTSYRYFNIDISTL